MSRDNIVVGQYRDQLRVYEIRGDSLIQKAWDFEPKTLGDHIRRRWLMLSITQEEAALRLGVNAWTAHNWETRQPKPIIQFILAPVAFLGCDPSWVERIAHDELLSPISPSR
jgi:DNA-binding XRE family transcriptional regulator